MSLGDGWHVVNPGAELAIIMCPHVTDEGTGVQRLHN